MTVLINRKRKHLGFGGKYAAGLIRHLNLSVEAVRTPTLPSSKLTYIDWLSQEYVA